MPIDGPQFSAILDLLNRIITERIRDLYGLTDESLLSARSSELTAQASRAELTEETLREAMDDLRERQAVDPMHVHVEARPIDALILDDLDLFRASELEAWNRRRREDAVMASWFALSSLTTQRDPRRAGSRAVRARGPDSYYHQPRPRGATTIDSGHGMTIDELLGEIDDVLAEHKRETRGEGA